MLCYEEVEISSSLKTEILALQPQYTKLARNFTRIQGRDSWSQLQIYDNVGLKENEENYTLDLDWTQSTSNNHS